MLAHLHAEKIQLSAVSNGELEAAIVEAAGDRADFVADGAESYHWFTEVVPGYRPSCFLTHGYHGSMGIGIGLPLGRHAPNRGRPLVVVPSLIHIRTSRRGS